MSELRPGGQVRVVDPRSDLFGATGHVIGRGEAPDNRDRWLVRFTTLGVTIAMHPEEIELIQARRRGGRVDNEYGIEGTT